MSRVEITSGVGPVRVWVPADDRFAAKANQWGGRQTGEDGGVQEWEIPWIFAPQVRQLTDEVFGALVRITTDGERVVVRTPVEPQVAGRSVAWPEAAVALGGTREGPTEWRFPASAEPGVRDAALYAFDWEGWCGRDRERWQRIVSRVMPPAVRSDGMPADGDWAAVVMRVALGGVVWPPGTGRAAPMGMAIASWPLCWRGEDGRVHLGTELGLGYSVTVVAGTFAPAPDGGEWPLLGPVDGVVLEVRGLARWVADLAVCFGRRGSVSIVEPAVVPGAGEETGSGA